jgi:hypothetical protein
MSLFMNLDGDALIRQHQKRSAVFFLYRKTLPSIVIPPTGMIGRIFCIATEENRSAVQRLCLCP